MKSKKTVVRVRGRQSGELGVLQFRDGIIGAFQSRAEARKYMKNMMRAPGGVPAYKYCDV